jgi:homoserine O-acetyltransferase
MVAWNENIYELDRFEFESGEVLAPLQLSYATTGNQESASEGAVVLLPSASGLKHWARAHVGGEGAFDPAQYFVITIDAIGGGHSSRPSEGLGAKFPTYTIRDNARAIHLLLTQGLGLTKLRAIGGPSMGAMIALEMGLKFPGLATALLLYSPAARCSALFRVLIRAMTTMARLPEGGVHAAGLAYFPSLVSHAYLERMPRAEVFDTAESVARVWVRDWDREDLISRYAAVASHDVTGGIDGELVRLLGELKSAALVMPSSSDGLLPYSAAAAMARMIPNSTLVCIESDLGHWAASQPPGTPEYEQLRVGTLKFLASLAGNSG